MWAVSLRNNSNPKAADQITDIGKSYGECLEAAKLYCQTSRYKDITVEEYEITWARAVKINGQEV